MRGKLCVKKQGGQKTKIKIRYLLWGLVVASAGLIGFDFSPKVKANNCPSLRLVFARGSGGERWKDQNYLAFKSALETKLATVNLDYEFIDLDYPAVGVGIDKLETTLGAWQGAGEAYEFGDSVKSGVKNLDKMINSTKCPETQYVIGGYSQGAMVVSQALKKLNPNRLIYAATFGDPKIYLPEGKGFIPPACRGENLSDYRIYVPDCQAYKGLLGAYVPYEPKTLEGKVGTWCNRRDIFCSSRLNISDHLGYVSDNLYDDASRLIFDKITRTFGLENRVSSPHDTVILIDSTGSMSDMIEKYKAEGLRLAKETLAAGGRVALYDYRDLEDPYEPIEHCNFETCTLEKFEAELAKIETDNGGDTPESLLSASFRVMSKLNWKYGSTKSLVVLTDANFLAPDRDGITLDQVVQLSKKIDPVNFYIITNPDYEQDYAELATKTDGKVITNFNELSLLTNYIMERYDSLPKVEETPTLEEKPTLTVEKIENNSETELTASWTTNGKRTLVILNDAILGVTEQTEITLTGLEPTVKNTLSLVPLGEDIKGDSVEIELKMTPKEESGRGATFDNAEVVLKETGSSQIPKAPNTGGH